MTAPTVADYEDLIRRMIANDTRCPSPICLMTYMGHLLDGLPDELIDLVKALDDEWQAAQAILEPFRPDPTEDPGF